MIFDDSTAEGNKSISISSRWVLKLEMFIFSTINAVIIEMILITV